MAIAKSLEKDIENLRAKISRLDIMTDVLCLLHKQYIDRDGSLDTSIRDLEKGSKGFLDMATLVSGTIHNMFHLYEGGDNSKAMEIVSKLLRIYTIHMMETILTEALRNTFIEEKKWIEEVGRICRNR